VPVAVKLIISESEEMPMGVKMTTEQFNESELLDSHIKNLPPGALATLSDLNMNLCDKCLIVHLDNELNWIDTDEEGVNCPAAEKLREEGKVTVCDECLSAQTKQMRQEAILDASKELLKQLECVENLPDDISLKAQDILLFMNGMCGVSGLNIPLDTAHNIKGLLDEGYMDSACKEYIAALKKEYPKINFDNKNADVSLREWQRQKYPGLTL
jgi:hypothetical protein